MRSTAEIFFITSRKLRLAYGLGLLVLFALPVHAAEPWTSGWQKSPANPVLSLSEKGAFDSHNMLAPAVIKHDGRYYLYYCGGPSGPKSDEDFINYQIGLATSDDGVHFKKHGKPLLPLGERDNFHCTPTLLRDAEGNLLRDDDGTWHMVYCGNRADDIEHATSRDGVHWEKDPRSPIFRSAYAPSLVKVGDEYRLYYTHKPEGGRNWEIHLATGLDLHSLKPHPENPMLVRSQPWENSHIIYPYVLRDGKKWVMFYAGYWKSQTNTAIGAATSDDGVHWTKSEDNPLVTPTQGSKYDSVYTSSQSVIRDGDLYRMYYAGRVDRLHKYFSIGQAIKPARAEPADSSSSFDWPGQARNRGEFTAWQNQTRDELRTMLGIPSDRVPLAAEKRGETEHDGIVIERWVFTCEPGSKAPAVLYRPKTSQGKMPAIVFTFGHGCSKIHWSYDYAAKLYAKLGLAVLAIDPIGEAERHSTGREGTREHDQKSVDEQASQAGRLIMGKLVFDTMRGVDFLMERKDVDQNRIGVAGYSLGGAKASWIAALDPRIKLALVCGWAYDDVVLNSKLCTKVPFGRMREKLSWSDFAALAAPHCAIVAMNGDADAIIDRNSDGSAWNGTRSVAAEVLPTYKQLGSLGSIEAWFEAEAGHRPFFAYREALLTIHKHLGTPAATEEQIRALPSVNAGRWCDEFNIKLEKLYGTPLHDRGATLVDMKLAPTPVESLRCLKPDELGLPDFTISGWLNSR
jgi:predicted GH43/DUF377 family glycosyl hydrolase/poly(3-hydroxybutyrate) depolymerase